MIRLLSDRADARPGYALAVAVTVAVAGAIAAALVLAGGVRPAGAEEGFVPGLGDVPLMAGLAGLPAGDVVFETAAGRIVEAAAVGTVAPQAVSRFYGETLPQLGWCAAANGVFYREGERLMVATAAAAAGTMVSFTLSPAGGDGCR